LRLESSALSGGRQDHRKFCHYQMSRRAGGRRTLLSNDCCLAATRAARNVEDRHHGHAAPIA
jgi:hypothetical protein